MAEPEKKAGTARKCAECGTDLPGGTPLELCPKCLLGTGLSPLEPVAVAKDVGGDVGAPGEAEQPETVVVANAEHRAGGLLREGEQLGHYRIIQPLGGGGMGAVFEADDLETGRRVALKVLSQTLDSPEARERFFREGRLAASINHPNSVYIFGTEEIAGTPVIAMELVAGGTLEDYVRAHGPIPPGQAVDAALQIIAGLEAAQRVGILHRDIKPSNCFRDLDGSIKIGDFGLSISTSVRTEPALTASGAFIGTPAFCSPEQLRGEELSARSDMYSVGATLFYLLTGRTPFEAKNVVALIATVLERTAPSPRQLRAGIPKGLGKVVRRCLEKQAGERFNSYEELRQSLLAYSSAAPVPATLGLRFVAGLMDLLTLSIVSLAGLLLTSTRPADFLSQLASHPTKAFTVFALAVCESVLYYTILEGCWGATLGKWICRLRVVGPNRSTPGILRALGRALIYVLLPTLPTWALYSGSKPYFEMSYFSQSLLSALIYLIYGLLFVTARRRNGFAALQDLATKTRVISRAALQVRPALAGAGTEPLPAAIEQCTMVGPYHVLDVLEEGGNDRWLLGYDLRLLRKVWIHLVPAGTPALASALRRLGRLGRLRWLTGIRSPAANWDAFEAVGGKPFLKLIGRQNPWEQVRFWLFDLADEMVIAEKDGTLPELQPDRVWITAEGRAKLLDFPAPGLTRILQAPQEAAAERSREREEALGSEASSNPPPQVGGCTGSAPTADAPPVLEAPGADLKFLREVALLGLEGEAANPKSEGRVPNRPLPLHARGFIGRLPELIDAAGAKLALRPLLRRPASVSRVRRAAIVAGCAAFPVIVFAAALFGSGLMRQWNRQNPELMELSQLLHQRAALRIWGKALHGPTDPQLGVYIASHYRSVITNETAWTGPFALMLIKGDARQFAEKSLSIYSAPTPQELAEAEAAIKPMIPRVDLFEISKQGRFLLTVIGGILVLYVGLPALIAALLFRGGLVLRLAGVAFVRHDGVLASRGRVFWRAIVVWSGAATSFLLSSFLARQHPHLALIAPSLLIVVLAGVSLAMPQRGLQDRLAGTWPVPR